MPQPAREFLTCDAESVQFVGNSLAESQLGVIPILGLTATRFARMGMGVAIVPRMCVRWEVERKLLAEVRIHQMKMPRSLYLVSRRGARLSHAAVGLMRLLHSGSHGAT